jgi:hypothetical protein
MYRSTRPTGPGAPPSPVRREHFPVGGGAQPGLWAGRLAAATGGRWSSRAAEGVARGRRAASAGRVLVSLDGQLKPGLELEISLPLDVFTWAAAAAPTESIGIALASNYFARGRRREVGRTSGREFSAGHSVVTERWAAGAELIGGAGTTARATQR